MPTKFLEGVSSKLADQWIATLLTPAFVFWAGGLLAYADHHGFTPIETWFQQFSDPMQLGLIAIALCTVAASAFVAQRFDTAVLRGLEGYWYPGVRRLSMPLLHWQKRAAAAFSKPSNSSTPSCKITLPLPPNGKSLCGVIAPCTSGQSKKTTSSPPAWATFSAQLNAAPTTAMDWMRLSAGHASGYCSPKPSKKTSKLPKPS